MIGDNGKLDRAPPAPALTDEQRKAEVARRVADLQAATRSAVAAKASQPTAMNNHPTAGKVPATYKSAADCPLGTMHGFASTHGGPHGEDLCDFCGFPADDEPTPSPVGADAMREAAIVEAARFLSDRLDDLEWHDGALEDTLRDFMGHVDPAHARLRAALEHRSASNVGEVELVRDADGLVTVPREPTEAMLGAGKCVLDPEIILCRDDALNVWTAMLNAAEQEKGGQVCDGIVTHAKEAAPSAADAEQRLAAALQREAVLRNALDKLFVQAIQSDINDRANEYGLEAIAIARAALTSLQSGERPDHIAGAGKKVGER